MADLAKPMATWSWVLGIDHASLRLLTGVVMLALWGFVECRVPRQCAVGGSGAGVIRWHRAVFATIALFIAMRHGVRLAFELQYLDPEWVPLARRSLHVLAGGLMAVWGNYLPKLLSPWQLEEERFDWQGVHWFVGWAFTIGGIGTMLTWVTLPIGCRRSPCTHSTLVLCLSILVRYSLQRHATYAEWRVV